MERQRSSTLVLCVLIVIICVAIVLVVIRAKHLTQGTPLVNVQGSSGIVGGPSASSFPVETNNEAAPSMLDKSDSHSLNRFVTIDTEKTPDGRTAFMIIKDKVTGYEYFILMGGVAITRLD